MEFLKDLSIDKLRNVAEDVYNQNKPKTDVEARVYEVLSHKNWGASSTLLNDIARDTLDSERFYLISKLLWENLDNPRPSAWRVVFKGLTLLEHLVKNGSERCVDDARTHSHSLRALYNFNYYEGTVDRGIGVRELSKKIVDLLADDDAIRDERAKARQLREKFGTRMDAVASNTSATSSSSSFAGYGYDNDNNASHFATTTTNKAHFGGRYSDTSSFHDPVSIPPASSNKTTSSSLSVAPVVPGGDQDTSDTVQKKNKKKKKKLEDLDTHANNAIDLLSFDAPAMSHTTAGFDDDFDAFQSAPTSSSVTQSKDPFDAFGDFTSASSSSSLAHKSPLPSQQPFDAFSTPVVASTVHHIQDSFSHLNVSSNSMPKPILGAAQPNKSFVTMTQSLPPQTHINTLGRQPSMTKDGIDDEFGDFEDAATAQRTVSYSSSSSTAVDPINKLISLDSLSTYKKKEDKLNDPIIFNHQAAQYVKEKQSSTTSTFNASTTQSKTSPFLGVDGLQKPINIMPHDSANHRLSGMPVMSSTSTSGGNVPMMSMMAQPNPNSMMTSQPMYASSLNTMGGSVPHPINMMNTTSMMGGNPMMMGGGGMNAMQTHQTQQQYSMNPTTMNTPNMGNLNPMGYNNPSSNNSSNRMGGNPMSGW